MKKDQEQELTKQSKEQVEVDPIKEFVALFQKVRALNPLGDGYCSLTVSGYGSEPITRVFYGVGCAFDVTSFAELQHELKKCDPASVKAKQIADLEAKLAELKGAI